MTATGTSIMESGSARHLWLVGALALTITFVIAVLTPLQARTNFWLRGPFYGAYLALFLALMLPSGALRARRYHKRRQTLPAMILLGSVAGYLAGLLAFLLHPLLLRDGRRLFLDSVRIETPKAAAAVVGFPLRLLSRLYGAIMAAVIVCLMRPWRHRQEPPAEGPSQ